MAYSNILKTGTYSYIDNVSINKNLKLYSFTFYVYENESKEKLILEKSYTFSCKYNLCKEIDKVYTSEKEIKKSLKEVYYNNPSDQINKPSVYDIDFETYNEIDIEGKEIQKTRLVFTRKDYSYIYYNQNYYVCENQIKINGIETNHYFDTIIYPSINNNIVEVLYNTLEIIEPSYKDYSKI